ncbi:MAG: reverse transcriptase domain-containing protein [Armatimonadota bacterium]|nr:hypothetical protein [bacterium]
MHTSSSPLLESIISDDCLTAAIHDIHRAGAAIGVDHQSLKEFSSNADAEIKRLRDDVLQGSYVLLPLRKAYIPKNNGGKRLIGVPCIRDRILGRSLVHNLNNLLESYWLDVSHGYRPKHSVQTASAMIQDITSSGAACVVHIDIKDFFPSVDHNLLHNILNSTIKDQYIVELLQKIILSQRWHDTEEPFTQGLCQGLPVSPLAANAYLHQFDSWLSNICSSVRYADDVVIFCTTREKASQIHAESVDFLQTSLLLDCNRDPKKCYIRQVEDGFDFLGLRFLGDKVELTRDAATKLQVDIEIITSTAENIADLVTMSKNRIFGWAHNYCMVNECSEIDRLNSMVCQRLKHRFDELSCGTSTSEVRHWYEELAASSVIKIFRKVRNQRI